MIRAPELRTCPANPRARTDAIVDGHHRAAVAKPRPRKGARRNPSASAATPATVRSMFADGLVEARGRESLEPDLSALLDVSYKTLEAAHDRSGDQSGALATALYALNAALGLWEIVASDPDDELTSEELWESAIRDADEQYRLFREDEMGEFGDQSRFDKDAGAEEAARRIHKAWTYWNGRFHARRGSIVQRMIDEAPGFKRHHPLQATLSDLRTELDPLGSHRKGAAQVHREGFGIPVVPVTERDARAEGMRDGKYAAENAFSDFVNDRDEENGSPSPWRSEREARSGWGDYAYEAAHFDGVNKFGEDITRAYTDAYEEAASDRAVFIHTREDRKSVV